MKDITPRIQRDSPIDRRRPVGQRVRDILWAEPDDTLVEALATEALDRDVEADTYRELYLAAVERLHVVTVDKVRRGAVIDGCQVEIADLSIDGRPLRTVGVEHEDPAQARRTVRVLGIAARRPSNYVRTLKEWLHTPDRASGGRRP